MGRLLGCFLCIGLLILSLSGCYGRIEQEDTVAITGFGVDLNEDGLKVFSAQVAAPSGEPEEGKTKSEALVLKNEALGYAQAGRLLLLGFPRTPIWSLSTTMLVGENLARKDLALMMDFVTRNRFIRPNILVFLTRGTTPDELMKVNTPPEDYSMQGLLKMTQGQAEQHGIYTPVTLRDFRTKYITPGVEAVLPQVEILEQNGEKLLHLNGTAVFKGHQLVGELDERESRGMRFLASKEIRGGLIPVDVNSLLESRASPLQSIVTMEITRSRAQHTVELSPTGIRVQIEIESDGNLYEQNNSGRLLTATKLPQLEDLTAEVIKDHALACISQAQLLKSDIFGWGLQVDRQNPAVWQDLAADWPQHFANLEVQVDANYSIRRSYLMEGSLPIQ